MGTPRTSPSPGPAPCARFSSPTRMVQPSGTYRKYAHFCKSGGLLKNHHGCPVQGTINAISGKWKVLAIWHLGFSPKRFAQLRKLLQGVSEKVLTSQLRQLETDGIINRKITHSSPPQVTYSLTCACEELIEPLSVLCAWGTRYLGIPPSLPRYP